MFLRASIVLLLVLNVGVALWWALRPPPAPAAMAAAPAAVPRLQLLDEVPAATLARIERAAAPSATAVPQATATTPVTDAAQCFSLGPFASAADAAAARARLPQLLRAVVREQRAAASRDWRVFLPPMASPQAAQAAAQRVAAAGFSDYMVVRNGDEANSLALGLYASEASARRRLDALVAAGFPARAEPLVAGRSAHWLDIAMPAGLDVSNAQARAGAAQRQPLACTPALASSPPR